jgi:hypothetical protein
MGHGAGYNFFSNSKRSETPMTLNLPLTPDLEERLSQEAARRGVPLEAYITQLLEQRFPPPLSPEQRDKAIALLRSWVEEGDEEEQRETGEYLIRALDEDRPEDRKLFPPEFKGVSW